MNKLIAQVSMLSFYALVGITPLLLTKYNYELFEFNKMLAVYALTTIIAGSWLISSVVSGSLKLKRSILDIPLLLFFLSQGAATVFSIDPHLSIWGYYGRFNGGLLSTICYLALYFLCIQILSRKNIIRIIYVSFATGSLVASYGIAQHYGLDAHLWVQDVQNRVFSTLGQPNWLAAYMTILLPIALAFTIRPLTMVRPSNFGFLILTIMFYITLLFTKSRSGFVGFWISDGVFWGMILLQTIPQKLLYRTLLKYAVAIHSILVILSLTVGTPFPQINILTTSIQEQITPPSDQPASLPAQQETPDSPAQPALNITDSGDIRKIVWEGSIEAIKANPVIGYGPETFAWAYYRYRPIAHNTTSEWDFLYNKAHNEYLNYAVTSGLVGLSGYLLILVVFMVWVGLTYKQTNNKPLETQEFDNKILSAGLFSGWLSILITNFFGFSVVVTNVYLFVIPALVYIISGTSRSTYYRIHIPHALKGLVSIALAVGAGYLINGTVAYWIADYHYNRGIVSSELNKYHASLDHLITATTIRPFEPNYHNELSETFAYLALASYELDEASASAEFIKASINESDHALSISPYNVSFWKNRTRIFYTLAQLDEAYYTDALKSIETAGKLAPTDAKILYNRALLENALGNNISAIETLTTTMQIKPNYRDAAWALALFYEEEGNEEEKNRWLQFILDTIDPNDSEVQKKLGL